MKMTRRLVNRIEQIRIAVRLFNYDYYNTNKILLIKKDAIMGTVIRATTSNKI